MRGRSLVLLTLALTAALAACHASTGGTRPTPPGSRYVFLWAGDADKTSSDFLAVVDADPRSATYASVVATLPVAAMGTRPHHTEYAMPAGGFLWANGFDASKTFIFDLRHPDRPALARTFGDPLPYGHPHSYARLPNCPTSFLPDSRIRMCASSSRRSGPSAGWSALHWRMRSARFLPLLTRRFAKRQ